VLPYAVAPEGSDVTAKDEDDAHGSAVRLSTPSPTEPPATATPPVDEPGRPEFVNLPDRFSRLGWTAWRQTIAELIANREVCFWLTRREITARYRQSIAGIGWAVVTPIAMVLTFMFLERAALISVGATQVPYALFVFVGLMPWQLFAASLNRSTQALIASAELVTRVRFPPIMLLLSAHGGALFDYAIGLGILAVLLALFGIAPSPTIVLIPLVLLVQLLLTLTIGLVLSILNAIARDVGSIVAMAVTLWMFLTPVLYPPAQAGPGALLNWLNPMSPIVVAYRDLVFTGHLTMPLHLGVVALVTVVLLPLCWRFFHVALPHVTERL
jgi:lipopolysaccharide transport system permease protein